MPKGFARVWVSVPVLALAVAAGTAQAKVKLTFAHWDDNPGIRATWERFNASQDEIEVEYRPIAFGEYMDKISVEMAAGQGPDIFSLMGWETAPMNFRAWVRDGLLIDLAPLIQRDKGELSVDRWFPFIMPMASYKGKVAGLPYGWSVFNAVNFNADLFDAAGMAYPDDSWTWETLKAASKKFVRTQDGNVVQRGLEVGDLQWWTVETMIHSAGGTVFNESETGLALNRPAALAAMDAALRFISEGAAVRGAGGWSGGKAAMRLAAIHWATVDVKQAKIQFRSGLAVTPKDGQTGLRQGNLVEIMLTGVNGHTKYPDAAWKALKFFTRYYGEVAAQAWGVIQFVPVAPAGLQVFLNQSPQAVGEPLSRQLPQLVPAMAVTARLPLAFANPALVDLYPEIKNTLSQQWGRVLNGQATVIQFAEDVNRLVTARLAGR